MDRLTEASNLLASELVREVVRTFGGARLAVCGTSMAPAIRPGDFISLEYSRISEILPGEIVVFARAGRLVTHRVVAKSGPGDTAHLVTRGDRTLQCDPSVSPSELVGRVTSVERGSLRLSAPMELRGPNHWFGRLLRSSDRATSLFLRLTALWQSLTSEAAECRS